MKYLPLLAGMIFLLAPPCHAKEAADAVVKSAKAPKLIQVELWEVSLREDADRQLFDAASKPVADRKEVLERIAKLRKQGAVDRSLHVKTSTVEACQARIQFGSREPQIAGVSHSKLGTKLQQVSYGEVGTIVQARPKIGADGRIVVELMFEQSYLRPGNVAIFTPTDGDAVNATKTCESIHQATLSCTPGGAMIASITESEDNGNTRRAILYLSASLVE